MKRRKNRHARIDEGFYETLNGIRSEAAKKGYNDVTTTAISRRLDNFLRTQVEIKFKDGYFDINFIKKKRKTI